MRRASPISARHLGLDALIVMPKTTPAIKVEAVGELGAEVVLSGDNYTEAKRHCDELVVSTGPHLRPPVRRRAGDCRTGDRRRTRFCGTSSGGVDAIFVPVGGGGLIAGIASYVKALRPAVRGDRRRALRGGRDVSVAGDGAAGRAGPGGHLRRRRGRPGGRPRSRSRSCSRRCARSCGCRTTRSARRSRTSSTTRARSWSRPARSRSPGCAPGSSAPAPATRGWRRSSAART